jgi:3D (Asp-Asp-Asp) domain-containing protein
MRTALCALAALLFAGYPAEGRRRVLHVSATAHSVEGTTADGSKSRPGTVAADPNIIPLGSRIRVSGAGKYSGVYTVVDTGRAIKGREIDIYMRSDAEAKKFGRKNVRVVILKLGDNAEARERAAQAAAK